MALTGEIVKVEFYDPVANIFVDTPPTIAPNDFCGVRARVKNTGDTALATVYTRILDPTGAVVYEPSPDTYYLATGEEVYTFPVLTLAPGLGDWSAEIRFLLDATEVDKWSGKIATVVERVAPPVAPPVEMIMMLLMVVLIASVLRAFKQSLLPA